MEKASAFDPQDKEMIFSVVRKTEEGFHGFNQRIIALMRTWVQQQLQTVAKEAEILLDERAEDAEYVGKYSQNSKEMVELQQYDEQTIENLIASATLLSESGNEDDFEEIKRKFERGMSAQQQVFLENSK